MAIHVGYGPQWETLANAISSYFGGGIESAQYQKVCQMLQTGEYTVEEMDGILQMIPEFERTYNANGELIRVGWKQTTSTSTAAGSIAQEVNSNVANATTNQFTTVQTITQDAQTGAATVSDELTKYSGGSPATTVKTVAGSAIAAIMAASAGITVGKTIDSILYNLNPDFWDERGMWALNPETWNTITAGDNSLGAKLFNMIYQIDPATGNPQPYMDETTFAYMVAYMASQGVFDSDGSYAWDGVKPETFNVVSPIKTNETLFNATVLHVERELYYFGTTSRTNGGYNFIEIEGFEKPSVPVHVTSCATNNGLVGLMTSTEPFSNVGIYGFDKSTMLNSMASTSSVDSYTYDNKTVYYAQFGPYESSQSILYNIGTNADNFNSSNTIAQTAWLMEYGDFAIDGIEGITNQPLATVFDPSGISDFSNIAAVLAALMTQYPELWDERIEVSPDGENVIKYIPVGFPTGGEKNQPTTNGATQEETAPQIAEGGENVTEDLIKTLIDIIQQINENEGMEGDTDEPTAPVNPNPTDTGDGDTPVVVIPTGSASALYSIYNPSQSELNDFGSWLWSSNFVDQLLKLFNDPMQAIIGLHKVFVTPPTSGRGDIKVGYLDSGVMSNLVNGQYVTVDCGSVNLNEYFGNVFDYDPFTQVYIYLPFIGIQKLDTGDVMRGKLNVIYHVNVITGACLAEIKVTRDLAGGTLYTYSGNCAVQYPISSGSYMGIIASAVSIAGGVVGTIASGGALAPMAMGAVGGALNAHTRVQHSGSFSGNAGAMGIKKPYLIITRPQTHLSEFKPFEGLPANQNVTIGECSGYVKFSECHIENVPATDTELNEIESLLKGGVIL